MRIGSGVSSLTQAIYRSIQRLKLVFIVSMLFPPPTAALPLVCEITGRKAIVKKKSCPLMILVKPIVYSMMISKDLSVSVQIFIMYHKCVV